MAQAIPTKAKIFVAIPILSIGEKFGSRSAERCETVWIPSAIGPTIPPRKYPSNLSSSESPAINNKARLVAVEIIAKPKEIYMPTLGEPFELLSDGAGAKLVELETNFAGAPPLPPEGGGGGGRLTIKSFFAELRRQSYLK